MNKVWFTADLHLKHGNIIKYVPRPFRNHKEQFEEIKKRFNSVVSKGDLTYILGDVVWDSDFKVLNEFNGQKIIIKGNHDVKQKLIQARTQGYIQQFYDVKSVKVNGQLIWLSHYAHRSWPNKHHGGWHLYGHSHGTIPDEGNSTDVGVDCWNYYPVSLEQLKEKFNGPSRTNNSV